MRNHSFRLFFTKSILKLKPNEELTEKLIVNTAMMITLVSFLFMISGCSYYRSVTRVNDGSVDVLSETINKLYTEEDYPRDKYPESNLQKMFFIEYDVFAVDSTGRWKLTAAEIINDTMYAVAELLAVPSDTIADIPGDGVSVRYHPKKEGDLLKRIFIYTEKVEFNNDGKAYFPVNAISQIITFKDHPAAKIGFSFLAIGGIITVLIITAIILAGPINYDD
jgi:hypothetical protein